MEIKKLWDIIDVDGNIINIDSYVAYLSNIQERGIWLDPIKVVFEDGSVVISFYLKHDSLDPLGFFITDVELNNPTVGVDGSINITSTIVSYITRSLTINRLKEL